MNAAITPNDDNANAVISILKGNGVDPKTFPTTGLASLALPGLSPFVSEFLVFIGTFSFHPVPAIIATVGVVLAASWKRSR